MIAFISIASNRFEDNTRWFRFRMLHHSTQPEKVFKSIKTILKKNGKAVILDLCEHKFKEFKTEMGGVHLGSSLEHVPEMAKNCFPKVEIKKMPSIDCECSGHLAEIFLVFIRNSA